MSVNAASAAPDSPEGLRPLPAHPSLEFERKEAKALLRQLRGGDPDALRRVRAHRRHHGGEHTPPAFKLTDAQFIIAREYGFASWPRLVVYFATWERHARAGPMVTGRPVQWAQQVQHLLAQHRAGNAQAAHWLAAFVPRFYGKRDAEILASMVTEQDAQLAVARGSRYSSWDALMHHVPRAGAPEDVFGAPFMQAIQAIRTSDIVALEHIVDAHPDVISMPPGEMERDSIPQGALFVDMQTRSTESRAICDWLVTRGANLPLALNRMLIQLWNARPEDIAFLLERGADPNWMPSNGISVLEHALVTYWNGEAVDVIARRVQPRNALWIAAGLGDVHRVAGYFDRTGALTAAARRERPDFIAIGRSWGPSVPDASDRDIMWEAFYVAGMNQRMDVIDALLERGFPIDYSPFGGTLLGFAVGNRMLPLVAHLIHRGANVDAGGTSTRENAGRFYDEKPDDPAARRIFELCGGTVPVDGEGVDRPASVPRIAAKLGYSLVHARHEAARLGHGVATLEHVLLGLLKTDSGVAVAILTESGVPRNLLMRIVAERVRTGGHPISEEAVQFDPVVDVIVDGAIADARARRRTHVATHHLIYSIITRGPGSIVDLFAMAGGDIEKIRMGCEAVL
jgi:hypothetical protein